METTREAEMLATLTLNDRIPYRLIDGKPTWLTVTEVRGNGVYTVRYPDGHTETLTDT